MKNLGTIALAVGAVIALSSSAKAVTYTSFTSATEPCTLNDSGPNNVICGGNASGSATLDVTDMSGMFNISVTGQNSQNGVFLVYANDTSGSVIETLAFGPGFQTLTFDFTGNLSSLIFVTDNVGGTANFQGILRDVSISVVPGPIAGAGLPALLALGGFVWARRRKAAATA